MNIFHRHRQKGFTLVETLVAISILLVSIGGPIYAVSSAVGSAIYARDQITAFYLAQDAIEFVRNMRDENTLKGRPWQTFLSEVAGCVSNSCIIETASPYTSSTFAPCTGDCTASPLRYYESLRTYNYDAGDESIFTRSIRFTPRSESPRDLRVQVTVTWRGNPNVPAKTFTVTENLFDWQ